MYINTYVFFGIKVWSRTKPCLRCERQTIAVSKDGINGDAFDLKWPV